MHCFILLPGGIEAFEEQLKKEEEAKEAKRKEDEQRRHEISQKTRTRLTKLLDRKRAEFEEEHGR